MLKNHTAIPVVALLLLILSALIFPLPRARAFTSVCYFSEPQGEMSPDYCFTDFAGSKKLFRDDIGFSIRDYSITVNDDSPRNAKDALNEWLEYNRRPNSFPGSWKDASKIQKEVNIDGVGKAYEFIGTDEQQLNDAVLDMIDDPEEGVHRRYTGEFGFLFGTCAVNFRGGTTLFNNDIDQAFNRNHRLQGYRNNADDLRYKIINSHPMSDHNDILPKLEEFYVNFAKELANRFAKQCGSAQTNHNPTPPAENKPLPLPYASCAIKCLDDIDTRYQCALPSPQRSQTDDKGVPAVIMPDGTTRSFSPRDNECVDGRSKVENACLSGCRNSIASDPMADPLGEGQKIKVAGMASEDPLGEAEKYLNLLKREPVISNKDYEDLKKIVGDYEAGKPMSVLDVKGAPEMQVPGSDEWVVLKNGDTIPQGARIFTGMDDDLLVTLPGFYAVKVLAFTDITFNKTGIAKALLKGEIVNDLDLRTGDVEIRVDKGTYQSSMQVRTPQSVAGVRGTHFWVSYDETERLGSIGVYEGEVAVDDLFRGTRTLLTPAQDKTPRAIVIASTNPAPVQNQKPMAAKPQTDTQEQTKTTAWWLIPVLVIAGGAFALYKTDKFRPIFQKMLKRP